MVPLSTARGRAAMLSSSISRRSPMAFRGLRISWAIWVDILPMADSRSERSSSSDWERIISSRLCSLPAMRRRSASSWPSSPVTTCPPSLSRYSPWAMR